MTSRFCQTGWKDQELQQELGADLRGHYDKLRLDSGVNIDEASQLLEQMETNELEYKKFSDWLGEEKAVMEELKLSCSKWR